MLAKKMTVRPRAVPIIAGFLFAATGIAFFIGRVLLFPGQLLEIFNLRQ